MDEHPFAATIRILGRGKKGARPLDRDEARQAMAMILAGEVEEVQLGAFLMLVRIKEETPEELAGFVEAARASLALGQERPMAEIDWPCYAGKRRQPPWFVLAARLLADAGHRIVMHGVRGRKQDRVYAEDALLALGMTVCTCHDDLRRGLDRDRLAYVPLEILSPPLQQMLELRRYLGLRSPINTLLRMLNPLAAPYMLQGIFHPGYLDIHERAGALLGQPHMIVFRGEGGEAERNPDVDCEVRELHEGRLARVTWPSLFTRRHGRPDGLDCSRLLAVWRGDEQCEYGEAAVIGTAALVLRLLRPALSPDEAFGEAQVLWQDRDRNGLSG